MFFRFILSVIKKYKVTEMFINPIIFTFCWWNQWCMIEKSFLDKLSITRKILTDNFFSRIWSQAPRGINPKSQKLKLFSVISELSLIIIWSQISLAACSQRSCKCSEKVLWIWFLFLNNHLFQSGQAVLDRRPRNPIFQTVQRMLN